MMLSRFCVSNATFVCISEPSSKISAEMSPSEPYAPPSPRLVTVTSSGFMLTAWATSF